MSGHSPPRPPEESSRDTIAGNFRQEDPLVGQIFDERYRIEGLIGGGGMGRVYRATQLGVDRAVAIKTLRPGNQEASDSHLRRFRREAATVSRLTHPNTVRLYDFGQTDKGELYLVTELLEGESLEALLEREVLVTPTRAVHMCVQALKALEEAHDLGIIHRDIKPANLFVCNYSGEPDYIKLLDFGIVWLAEQDRDHRLTETGLISGTPHYMSPERAQGAATTTLEDVYAMGVVLFQMLTGNVPFDGPTPVHVMFATVHSDLPPHTDWSIPVPPRLGDLVERCLSKRQDLRPSSAKALREELEQLLHDPESLAVNTPPFGHPAGNSPSTPSVQRANTEDIEERPANPNSARTLIGPAIGDTTLEPPLAVQDTKADTGGRKPAMFTLALVVLALSVYGGWRLLGASDPAADTASPAEAVAVRSVDAPTPEPESSPPTEDQPAPTTAEKKAQPAAPVVEELAASDDESTADDDVETADAPTPAPAAVVLPPVDARAPLQETAHIRRAALRPHRVSSVPAGATVRDAATKARLGRTPLTLYLAPDDTRSLSLERTDYHRRKVDIAPTSSETKVRLPKVRVKVDLNRFD